MAVKPPILVLVHPGSACGSADFNIGKVSARSARADLIAELEKSYDRLIIIHGELCDEIEFREDFHEAIEEAKSWAKSLEAEGEGMLVIMEGPDGGKPNQEDCIRKVVKKMGKAEAQKYQFIVTGAWYHPIDGQGCVGSVVNELRKLGCEAEVSPSAVCFEESQSEEDAPAFELPRTVERAPKKLNEGTQMKQISLKHIQDLYPPKGKLYQLQALLGTTDPQSQVSIPALVKSHGLDHALWCCQGIKHMEITLRGFALDCALQVRHLLDDEGKKLLDTVASVLDGNNVSYEELAARTAAVNDSLRKMRQSSPSIVSLAKYRAAQAALVVTWPEASIAARRASRLAIQAMTSIDHKKTEGIESMSKYQVDRFLTLIDAEESDMEHPNHAVNEQWNTEKPQKRYKYQCA